MTLQEMVRQIEGSYGLRFQCSQKDVLRAIDTAQKAAFSHDCRAFERAARLMLTESGECDFPEDAREIISVRSGEKYEIDAFRRKIVFGGNIRQPDNGLFTDPRDGREYRTVRIGKQVWMAENLDYAGNVGAYYGNNPANGYGRLYTWNEAIANAPQGWHLPTDEEWETLINFAGGVKNLKAKEGWNNDGNGLDTFGFAALPGGNGGSDGSFYNAGYGGSWWSASEYDADYAYYRDMNYYNAGDGKNYNNKTTNLHSVRCVKNNYIPIPAGEARYYRRPQTLTGYMLGSGEMEFSPEDEAKVIVPEEWRRQVLLETAVALLDNGIYGDKAPQAVLEGYFREWWQAMDLRPNGRQPISSLGAW